MTDCLQGSENELDDELRAYTDGSTTRRASDGLARRRSEVDEVRSIRIVAAGTLPEGGRTGATVRGGAGVSKRNGSLGGFSATYSPGS